MSRDISASVTLTPNNIKIILTNLGLYRNNKLHTRLDIVLYNYPQIIQSIINATTFLRYNADIKTRIHCIMQGISEQPVCKFCGCCVAMRRSGKYINTFPSFCSSNCAAKHTDTKAKRVQTNISRYGVDNLLKVPTNRYNGS